MVHTRSGKRTGRIEEYAQRLEEYHSMVPQTKVHVFYPKRYRERDYTHRHRIRDPELKDEFVQGYHRRPSHR